MSDEVHHVPPIVEASGEFSVTVKRNCSLSPRTLFLLLAGTAAVSFAIGIGFALVGAWMVLPFAGLEVLALAAAFYCNARHAGDFERISLRGGMLRVEAREGSAWREHEFNPVWARLLVRDSAAGARAYIRSHGRELEIARHLTPPARGALVRALGERLARVQQQIA
jgi:uncharacterized membrane protein